MNKFRIYGGDWRVVGGGGGSLFVCLLCLVGFVFK